METLGTMFAAHPPIGPFRVEVADGEHPISAGIEAFETIDELYLSHTKADLHVLFDTLYRGQTPGFTHSDWEEKRHPLVYLRPLGEGAVLYNALGHCRGHHDLAPLSDWWPSVERCSWDIEIYRELLRRGMTWAKQPAVNRMIGEE
jgi:type 1 glutamine amidotransferase